MLQTGLVAETPIELAAQLFGLGFAATVVSGLVALGYRWYVRERVPTGLAVLFGLTVISVYLGTTGSLGQAIDGQDIALEAGEVVPNLAAFAVGAVGSAVGIRVGDAIGTDISAATGEKTVNADVSEIVQTVGRVTPVRLPDEIDDIVGYDPMPEKTKGSLEGRRFLFPRRLTKGELRERLVARLKTDYGVGHVDLELGDDGTVEYIAIGARAAGIGPTLPPSTNAVAIRADPAHAASSGDLVQVWSTDPLERVLTGELRGVTGDVVTVAIDAADTSKFDQTTAYKLVTLPVQDRPDREFASLLRAADETLGTITVASGTELDGATVGELGVTVVAITRDGSGPDPIPLPERTLAAGDVVYALAKPEALRRAEAAASRMRQDDIETEPSTADGETTAGSTTSESGPETTPDDSPGQPETKADSEITDTDSDGPAPVVDEHPDEISTALEKLSEDESVPAPSGTEDTASDSPAEPGADLAEFVAEPGMDDESDADESDTVRIWDPEERLDAIESDEDESTDRTQD